MNAPGLLVADIDRGGVFASIIGTFCLLDDAERALLRSFAVNRFRGDAALFADGVEILRRAPDGPVSASFRWRARSARSPRTASAWRRPRHRAASVRASRIVRLPHISNFTDFRLLAPFAEWITRPVDGPLRLRDPARHEEHDRRSRRGCGQSGSTSGSRRRAAAGATVIGVCGGYQMMGETIADPLDVESAASEARGLGLLPVRTTCARRRRAAGRSRDAFGHSFAAYEIHMGETAPPARCRAVRDTERRADRRRAHRTHASERICTARWNAPEVSRELLGCADCRRPRPSSENYDATRRTGSTGTQRGFEELYL